MYFHFSYGNKNPALIEKQTKKIRSFNSYYMLQITDSALNLFIFAEF